MNRLRETEAILALHECGHSQQRIADLLNLKRANVGYRIRYMANKDPSTVETLQEEVEYWRGHASHYRRMYEELKGKGASNGETQLRA